MDIGIGGYSPSPNYGQIASGNRINQASDDAAGLAISERQKGQITDSDVGANNLSAGRDAMNIADGALGGVSDYLQRIGELAVQAGNGLMSDSDRRIIQNEIDGLKQGISDATSQATYNNTRLLDGSRSTLSLYAGGRRNADLGNSSLKALGIADFDVTKEGFDISAIDKAIEQVSGMRSSMGATTNGLESSISYLQNSSYNTTAALSREKDLDIGSAVSQMKKDEAMQKYQNTMQRQKMDNERANANRLFSTMF